MMKKALKILEKPAKLCYKNITWLKLGLFAGEANVSKLFFIDAGGKAIMKKILLTVLFLMGAAAAWADVNITVTPIESPDALRFGRVANAETVTREVRVRITSTTPQRYQVSQMLADPISDGKGGRLPDNGITYYTLRSSNARGSLYQDVPSNLDTANRIIYNSDPSGDGDSFIIAYNANGQNINSSGSYTGRISYLVTPQGSGSESQVYLNIYLDAERNVTIDVVTSTSAGKTLNLSTQDKGLSGEVMLTVKGGLGKQYSITQLADVFPQNEQAELLADGAVNFSIKADKGTSQVAALVPLTRKSEKIYLSDNQGSEDTVVVKFAINMDMLKDVAVGKYNGRVTYTIESQGAVIDTIPVALNIEIKPVFQIQVTPEDPRGLVFAGLKAANQPVTRRATLNVTSNLKRPYCVVQKLASPLTNQTGATIPMQKFTLREGIDKDQSGQVIFPTESEMKVGDTVIFNSDNAGDAAQFVVDYTVTGFPDLKSGDYYVNLSYSLMEK